MRIFLFWLTRKGKKKGRDFPPPYTCTTTPRKDDKLGKWSTHNRVKQRLRCSPVGMVKQVSTLQCGAVRCIRVARLCPSLAPGARSVCVSRPWRMAGAGLA